MKNFEVPTGYRSPLITAIKQQRKAADKLKKDFTPTELDFGKVKIYLARHFGFCYGVEMPLILHTEPLKKTKAKGYFY